MSVGGVWGSLSSNQKILAVFFLVANVLMLAAVPATLGVIYSNAVSSDDDTTTTASPYSKFDREIGWVM